MKKMIAFCGLICTDCPAYIATIKNDKKERKKVAQLWSTDTHVFDPEEICCDGCLALNMRLMKFCRDCEVRKCGIEKNVVNCAHCDKYPCDILDKLLVKMRASEAKAILDKIRRTFKK